MTRRAAEHARRITSAERTDSLRRRILAELLEEKLTTGELADLLESPSESISRVIGRLREEGFLETEQDPGDGRLKPHCLTAAGEIELNRHYAYGRPRLDPLEPTHRQRVDFLYSALEAAVQMRRKTNQLEDAATRISVVLREARKLGEGGLVIEAINELATTLRQIPASDVEVHALLDELERIGLGESPFTRPSLVMPALSHREYSLGRLGENRDHEGPRRERHLTGALNLYSQLAAVPRHLDSHKWRERQGWTLISLARNLRARSDFEEALEEATQALLVFEELENPYGKAHCHHVFGDCLRLMGDFDGAWQWLSKARVLAEEHSYVRFRAELMVQVGEVLRYQRKHDEARGALEESRDLADEMGLRTTRAFAHSALGAVAFHERDLATAQLEFGRADGGFKRLKHGQGLALNARRQAVAARLRYEETKQNLEEVERLIQTARGYYRHLGSPAGVTACQIEEGRLRIAVEGAAPKAVADLMDLIENRPAERNLVELDPWVPRVMDVFAEETKVEVFIRRSKDVLQRAQHRLAKRARVGVERAAELMGRTEAPPASTSAGAGGADEMAGETRQAGRSPQMALA